MLDKRIINQCSIILTRNCNLRCDFCFAKNAGYNENEMVSFENLKKIIDFCSEAKTKYIFFTGGEPLLYPFLNEILLYSKEKQYPMTTAVATNGVLLEDYQFCRKLMNSGLDYIDISMKGRNPQEWLDNTRYDGYSRQLKAIKNISALQMDFTCSMVLTLDNVFSLCDSVKNAIENGAKQFSFTFIIDNNKNIESNANYFKEHNPFILIESFISQIDQLNNLTDEWWVEYSFPYCIYSEKQLKILEGRMASPCQIHKRNAITFDTQLNLLPCDMYFDNKIGKLGRDFNSISELLMLRDRNPYKETIEDINKLPSSKCIECEYIERCYGGCPVLWNNYSFDELMEYKRKNYI